MNNIIGTRTIEVILNKIYYLWNLHQSQQQHVSSCMPVELVHFKNGDDVFCRWCDDVFCRWCDDVFCRWCDDVFCHRMCS